MDAVTRSRASAVCDAKDRPSRDFCKNDDVRRSIPSQNDVRYDIIGMTARESVIYSH